MKQLKLVEFSETELGNFSGFAISKEQSGIDRSDGYSVTSIPLLSMKLEITTSCNGRSCISAEFLEGSLKCKPSNKL
jgi:hypothetical protein